LFHTIKSSSCPGDLHSSQCNGSVSSTVPLDPEFDYAWLHEIGTGTDDCGLPHHVSSDAEISRLVEIVASLLQKLPRPAAITIARSSNDDYCPTDKVDYIQELVLSMLKSVYNEEQLDIQLKYNAETH
jgi:hypothetical protein